MFFFKYIIKREKYINLIYIYKIMFQYIKNIYYHIKLSINLFWIYYKNIDIKNDIYWINTLKNNINNCGCMMIKCTQWILPKLQLMYKDTLISKEFNIYYEKCNIHSIEDTEKIFINELNISIYDNFKIIKLLGSGSIGQVYLIENIHNGSKYAMKINHPNIMIDYHIFYLFYKFILLFINYKKYIPIYNIDSFIISLKSQTNLKNECNYNKYFQQLYNNNDVFIIPKIHLCTENILIMDYINGEKYEITKNPENIYIDFKKMSLLSIFVNYNCLKNTVHGDLHCGNWRIVSKNNCKYQLIIYDFGFCFNIDNEEYLIIDNLLTSDNKENVLKDFFNYYTSRTYNNHLINCNYLKNIEKLYDKYKEKHSPTLELFLKDVIEVCIDNKILLTSSCLNGFLLFLQLSGYYDNIKILSSDSNYPKYIKNLINQCKDYNICDDLVKYLENKIIEEKVESLFENNFEDFKSLESLCLKKS